MAHGSGGKLSHELVERVFVARFSNTELDRMDDAAVVELGADGNRMAFTTDSYVVSPIVFPGGDIGKLAVCGTINDLSMMGARPLYLSTGWIIEEGLTFGELERIADSMAETARDSGVRIVAGDTKVVDRGHADKLFINTAGIGIVPRGVEVAGANAEEGDVVRPGLVLIAPGAFHMKVVKRKPTEVTVELSEEPRDAPHIPSVDVTMSSVAEVYGERSLGIILTGMGHDGREGMKDIKKRNGRTIAQSEESCVVFGMPKSAIEAGVVDTVMSPSQITGEIINMA